MQQKYSGLFILLFFMFAALSSACVAGKGQFHPPQMAAERALDKILQITDDNFTMLKVVQGYLNNKSSKNFKYSHQFTVPYLRAWTKGQIEWLRGACEGRDKNTDPYYDCGYLSISCVRDANYPYVYRTEKIDAREVIISYTWPRSDGHAPGSDDAYATYRMIKDGDEWKLDGADCGDAFNMK